MRSYPSPGLVLAALELQMARVPAWYLSLFLGACVGLGIIWYALFAPPVGFPVGRIIEIPEGVPAGEVARLLQDERVVSEALFFHGLAALTGDDAHLQAGKYQFNEPLGLLSVMERLRDGISGIELVRVRLEEGMTARDMGRKLAEMLPGFSADEFIDNALPLEGYLFPDTYFFMPDATPDEVIERLYAAFESETALIEDELAAFDRPLPDVLVMASLLEREARTLTEKRMIAGILWNRIELDMPLQVDAVFGYIHDRPTYHPSFSDLEIESPYNTYIYKGLPPGPIANPGITSILAAVTPTKTQSLFYLTGNDGLMHYARTFAEHKTNRARYLD